MLTLHSNSVIGNFLTQSTIRSMNIPAGRQHSICKLFWNFLGSLVFYFMVYSLVAIAAFGVVALPMAEFGLIPKDLTVMSTAQAPVFLAMYFAGFLTWLFVGMLSFCLGLALIGKGIYEGSRKLYSKFSIRAEPVIAPSVISELYSGFKNKFCPMVNVK